MATSSWRIGIEDRLHAEASPELREQLVLHARMDEAGDQDVQLPRFLGGEDKDGLAASYPSDISLARMPQVSAK